MNIFGQASRKDLHSDFDKKSTESEIDAPLVESIKVKVS